MTVRWGDDEENERRRRRQIAYIMRMKEQEKPPRKSTLQGDAELNKIREMRREARNR